MRFINISSDASFDEEIKRFPIDSNQIIVVYFSAVWCSRCSAIEPELEELSNSFPSVVFFKVDVDVCSNIVSSFGISLLPTFVLFRGNHQAESTRINDISTLRQKVTDMIRGSNKTSESSGVIESNSPSIAPVPGYMDLVSLLDKTRCECLNCHNDHGLECALTKDMSYLMSDTDEQLIISLAFSQPVKLHSLKITAPEDSGPKNIKIFTNTINTPDFCTCESSNPVQAFVLTPEDLTAKSLIQLKYAKFQNVHNVTIFIQDNQSGSEETRITNLILYGCPVQSVTNMSDFKRVVGKKGEAHG